MTLAPITRTLAILTVAATLSACASDKVWMRSGSSSTDADIDEMNCAQQAESSSVSVSVGGDIGPKTDRFSNRYACLRSQGYRLRELSSEEAAKLKALGGVDREIYWNELLTKNGLTPASTKPIPAVPQPAAGLPGQTPAPPQ